MNDKDKDYNQELFDSFEIIATKEKEKDKEEVEKYKSFLPSPFITAALPARNVNKPVFVRRYNNITLHITATSNVPYGKYGRLLLTILTTHAVINKKNNEPVTIQYKSLNELMRELQIPTSRCNEIKEQLNNFSGASFVFTEKVTTVTQSNLFKDLLDDEENNKFGLNDEVKATKNSTGHISFIKQIRYLDVEDRKGEKTTAAIDIVLNEDFVKFSQDHSVPIDYSVYKSITSSLGKDLYAWFVYKNNGLTTSQHISREAMVSQFLPVSEDKACEKDRKDQARSNWAKIKEQIMIIKEKHYPELKVTFDDTNMGLTIYKSPAPILKNDTRYILVTANLK